jgi:hypothetical protein
MAEHDATRTNGDGTSGASAGAAVASAAAGTAAGTAAGAPRRAGSDPITQVRAADLEPYTGLGYLSKLFRLIAVFLVLLLAIEVGTGLYREGSAALPTLLSEASRLVVLAGLLWGVGDLANLLIDVGHDVRAARILLGRQVAHMGPQQVGPQHVGHQQAGPPIERSLDRDGVVDRVAAPARGDHRPVAVADRADPELHP